MCDCPVAGMVTSHEAYSSWVFFKECKTENGAASSVQTSIQSSSESSSHTNQDLDNIDVLINSLEPNLRPATPDFSNPKSVALYEESKQLVTEYWKVQTELCLWTQKKNQLMAAELEDQRKQKQLKALQEEKESMIVARNLLQQQQKQQQQQQQQQQQSSRQNPSSNASEGWYIVPREGDS